MNKLPHYEAPANPRVRLSTKANDTVHMMKIVSFLKWVLRTDKLEIANYLSDMKDESFFLVAATGLGKTVGVPVHVLIRQIQRSGRHQNPKPKVWVVEPRIPIAIEQQEYMNKLWDEYCTKHDRDERRMPPLFGCVTSVSVKNPDALIQFVTTGIFEGTAKDGKYHPVNDRVIIDEAHVTVEQNPLVELGIALAHKAGVTIDYMSATVDVTGIQEKLHVATIIRADKVRNDIWKTNLQHTLDESIVELVDKTLVNVDTASRFFPDPTQKNADKVIQSATDPSRSHGMLVVVNSFSGETSDINKLTRKIQKNFPTLLVLQLAGDVIRDPKRQAEFKRQLTRSEQRKENYVILSTSVVEMGITFPTLDFAVTMDSGYDQETIGDVTFPVIAPLGVNSLLQRIGRVGRRFPGIAYISNEVDAEYSSLEDSELNRNGLSYEPIRYPLAYAPLMTLAFYAVKSGVKDYHQWLSALALPSNIHDNEDRMEYFDEQITKLDQLGIAKDGKLTKLGSSMEQWIGRADIAYATQLQKRFTQGASREEVLFWLVATALSNTSVVQVKAQHGYFVDYADTDKRKLMPNRIDLWSNAQHEDLALFRALATAHSVMPKLLWSKAYRSSVDEQRMTRWANWAGVDSRKFFRAAQDITDAFKLFMQVNGKSDEFRMCFGTNARLNPELIRWSDVYAKLPVDEIKDELVKLSGTTVVSVAYNEDMDAYDWEDTLHGHKGMVKQNDTPIRLLDRHVYSARVMPSRESKSDVTSWRLSSIGELPQPKKPTPEPVIQPVAREVPTAAYAPAPKPSPVRATKTEAVAKPTQEKPPQKKRGFWANLFNF